jgi:opacity protein-like surface antigen
MRSPTSVAALALAALCLVPALAAQAAGGRVTEQHTFDDNEGRLLGYYSAAVSYTPLEAAIAARPWTFELGSELSYVPRLSTAQRTAGRDKPEATNLAPVFPRPRAALQLPGGFRLEGSWIPPIRFFDIKANLYGVALSAPVAAPWGISLTPRVSYTGGRVSGPITCNTDLLHGDLSFQVYYTQVCHDRESDDHFEPSQWTGELFGSGKLRGGSILPYAGIGVQHENTKFDIGVLRADGTRDLDHPILQLRATRGYGFGGITWMAPRNVRLTSELFYAPGSLFTARIFAGYHFDKR